MTRSCSSTDLSNTGREAQAVEILQLAIDRGDRDAYLNLAGVLHDIGDMRESETQLRLAIAHGHHLAHRAYALLLEELGRDEESLVQAELATQSGHPVDRTASS